MVRQGSPRAPPWWRMPLYKGFEDPSPVRAEDGVLESIQRLPRQITATRIPCSAARNSLFRSLGNAARKSSYKQENQARWPARRTPNPREFPVFSPRSGNWAAETGSRWTSRSANQSAAAETSHAHSGTAREISAIPRGLGEAPSRIPSGDDRAGGSTAPKPRVFSAGDCRGSIRGWGRGHGPERQESFMCRTGRHGAEIQPAAGLGPRRRTETESSPRTGLRLPLRLVRSPATHLGQHLSRGQQEVSRRGGLTRRPMSR